MHSEGKCMNVGVFGLHAFVGTTWTAVSLATYFGDVRGRYTAAAEYGVQQEAFAALAKEQEAEHAKRGCFCLGGVDFYPKMNGCDIAKLKNSGYEICIIDLGHDFNKAREILYSCDLKILVGCVAPWRMDDYELVNNIEREVEKFDSWRFLISYGNEKLLRKLKGLPMKADFMYCEANPLYLSDKSIHRLFKLLS